ncbi:hypothetical protein TcasGA2_TC033968 [Tribolium castaneum]|uniref:Ricin B lectin domain-containing protein n=1 Tax=Tribolium castaneum TaxID=7070 RepID=A0A139WDS3_TRICA|nr:PREDICTED: uncharacterized protein LOC103313786 [Tribolium castaneum]KYB26099.1 hypothetical protein TcasGA2_TC033968 [Tribolium castaneum]|eukprot:XP_008196173.1 PREDICTED: uncharacterized protein LOC103313786 [Tribolium castaneum]
MNFICAFVLLFGVSIVTGGNETKYCESSEYFMIKHQKSGLVIDGKGEKLDQLKIETATKSMTQLWSLKMIEFGKFIIINRATGRVLDIRYNKGAGSDIIAFPKHCKRNQQWIIDHSTGHIAATYDNLVIEINAKNFVPGSGLVANPKKKGQPNQVFTIEPV